jgi:hypothetical protein
MISDQVFDFLQSDGSLDLVEVTGVSPEVFAAWYSNAKKIRRTITVTVPPDPDVPGSGDVSTSSLDFTQWLHPFGGSDDFYENTGDHPLPLTAPVFLSVEVGVALYSSPSGNGLTASWGYYAPDLSDSPFLVPLNHGNMFIHHDKFYYHHSLNYNRSNFEGLSINAKTIKVKYEFNDGITQDVELEIIDYFYPVS